MQATIRSSTRVALGDASSRLNSNNSRVPLKAVAAPTAAPSPIATAPDASPVSTFTLTPNTCVPSLLHVLGMSQYAPLLMEHGITVCGQLYSMPYEVLRPYFESDEHCDSVVAALHSHHHMPMTAPTPVAPLQSSARVISVRRNDPYQFNCLSEERDNADYEMGFFEEEMPSSPAAAPVEPLVEEAPFDEVSAEPEPVAPTEEADQQSCTCLVHFKYRQTEYSSPTLIRPGQYVMVSGDRGMDLGLVLRVNTADNKAYVERTGPQGVIQRPAYQKEVEYYNGALRLDESAATEICRAKVQRLGLNMEVHYAEYQYDKKKLTFYYESRARVDFVALLKDLFREFGCRIWMEKVPRNNIPVALA